MVGPRTGWHPPPGWRLAGDVALALGLVALAELAVTSGAVAGNRTVNLLLGLGMTAPVAWRRRAPVAVVAVSMTCLAAQVALYGSSETAAYSVLLFVLVYALTTCTRGRATLLGLTLVVGVGIFFEARDRTIHSFSDALFIPLVVLVAAGFGVAVAQARARGALSEQRLAELEVSRERERQLVAADERTRIARELHDVLAHSVSVMVVQAEAAEEMLDHAPDRARAPLAAVQATGREALVELRHLLGALRTEPVELAPRPGVTDIPALISEASAAGSPVQVTVIGRPTPLPDALDLTVYRIVQESLTNARKHAPGSSVQLTLDYAPDRVEVLVVNPVVCEPDEPTDRHGHGLPGMSERVALCGGTLHAGTDASSFRIRARFPLATTP